MNRVQHFAQQAATALLVSLFADDVGAQCMRYSVKRPPPLGTCGILTEVFPPTNISPQGDLVGWWSCAGGNERAMVAWDAQDIVLVPLPNTEVATAEDMNSKAAVVGIRAVIDLGYRGFHYQNGQLTDLGWLKGHNWAEAHSLSDALVVGMSSNVQTGPQLACRWVQARPAPLPFIAGPNSSANSVNSSNMIVGWAGNAPLGGLQADAVLWIDGEATALTRLPNATNCNAISISDNNMICGHCALPDSQGAGDYKRRAVAWLNGQVIDLGTIPAILSSFALDVNSVEDIVGYCQNPPQLGNNLTGFIWRGGVIRKLDDFIIPNPEQYRVQRAVGINDSGQIAVNLADGKDAARLDPVPPRAGDTNCDWLVNVTDLLAVINAWGPAPPQVPFEGSPDLNTDGLVNVLDLLAVINDWG